MNNINKQQKPVILVLAGHDPTGGAGIQADIETIAHANCHAATVITSLTIQNTAEVIKIEPQSSSSFRKQIELLLDEMEISACKIGLLGDTGLIDIATEILTDKNFPIVLDPVITAGNGTVLTNKNVCKKLISHLIPISTIITPNSEEARSLTGEDNLSSAADKLMQYGAENVLITGTHEDTENVINTFYSKDSAPLEYSWKRFSDTFHGSGCTLSARISAQLALGKDVSHAQMEAQLYTWQTLSHGLSLGQTQKHPNRFFKPI